jgi:hypothetical protein
LAPVVVVVAVVDRRHQEASLQAEEEVEAEAEVVRLARVPDPVVEGAAAVQAAVEAEVEVEVEAELSPVLPAVEAELSPVPLTPELSHQVQVAAGNFTKSLLRLRCPGFRESSLAERLNQNFRQPSWVENQGICFYSRIRKEGSASSTMLSIRCSPSADAVT